MFFGKKKQLVFSVNGEQLEEAKIKIEQRVSLFNELREDLQHLFALEDYEVFISGPIDAIDETLRRAFLPRLRKQYILIIGSIKYLRFLVDPVQKEDEKQAIKFFKSMINKNGDIADDIIETLREPEFSSKFEKLSDVTGLVMSGPRVSGHLFRNVTSKQETQFVVDRIDSLFSILLTVMQSFVVVS